jgi:hypothetical protein
MRPSNRANEFPFAMRGNCALETFRPMFKLRSRAVRAFPCNFARMAKAGPFRRESLALSPVGPLRES